jgi:hypothetical protein
MAKFVKVRIVHKLGLHCKTRRNSTKKMISIVIPYEFIFKHGTHVENVMIVQ